MGGGGEIKNNAATGLESALKRKIMRAAKYMKNLDDLFEMLDVFDAFFVLFFIWFKSF